MLTEFRNDWITDMLKIVYPPKTLFRWGYNKRRSHDKNLNILYVFLNKTRRSTNDPVMLTWALCPS